MINRIPCKCLLISSLSGLTRKRGMARASLAIPTRFLVAPDKLDIKRHKLGILYLSWTPHTSGDIASKIVSESTKHLLFHMFQLLR